MSWHWWVLRWFNHISLGNELHLGQLTQKRFLPIKVFSRLFLLFVHLFKCLEGPSLLIISSLSGSSDTVKMNFHHTSKTRKMNRKKRIICSKHQNVSMLYRMALNGRSTCVLFHIWIVLCLLSSGWWALPSRPSRTERRLSVARSIEKRTLKDIQRSLCRSLFTIHYCACTRRRLERRKTFSEKQWGGECERKRPTICWSEKVND